MFDREQRLKQDLLNTKAVIDRYEGMEDELDNPSAETWEGALQTLLEEARESNGEVLRVSIDSAGDSIRVYCETSREGDEIEYVEEAGDLFICAPAASFVTYDRIAGHLRESVREARRSAESKYEDIQQTLERRYDQEVGVEGGEVVSV